MTTPQAFIIAFIHSTAKDDQGFLELFKYAFNRKQICEILGINRNRYYYLVRTSQLDKYILKLRGSEHTQVADSLESRRLKNSEVK